MCIICLWLLCVCLCVPILCFFEADGILAFNHPLNLVAHQVVPAVATGCPVVIKPSLNTPLSCINFVERLRAAGLEEPWCQVLLADNAVVDALAREPAVNYLSFIGSARVGWQLRSNAAPGTRVALEHGGVGPVIVDKSCDFDTMIPALAHGAFYHAGQVCVATQRVFVPNSMVDVVSSSLASAAEFMPVGDPLDIKTKVRYPFYTFCRAEPLSSRRLAL